MTFDPLSSQGIFQALESGLAAARVIEEFRRVGAPALDVYAADIAQRFTEFLQTQTHYYRREDRWPASIFWRRR